MPDVSKASRLKSPTFGYIILSCLFTWSCWISAMLLADAKGYILPGQDNYLALIQNGFSDSGHVLLSVLFVLGGFGPLVAALLVSALRKDKASLAFLARSSFKFKLPLKCYLQAIGLAVAVAAVPFVLALLTPLATINLTGLLSLAPFLLPILLWEVLHSFGEEPGWRGWLLAKLQQPGQAETYIWLMGFIWAFWHYPYVIYHSLAGMPAVGIPEMIGSLVFALAGYTMALIGQSYLYVWLFNQSKSVWLAVFFHGLLNVTTLILVSSIEHFSTTVSLLVAFMPWVLVIVLKQILGKPKFPGQAAV